MAHKTLVGGTAYAIKGGRCLVNGTGYSIQKGRTLVGGTGYDISFVHKVAVTITGSGNASYSYATIGGTKYSSAASAIEVLTGDIITFGAYGVSINIPGKVTIDGVEVLTATNRRVSTYEWTVPSGISTISINLLLEGSSSSNRRATITVTTS